MSEGRPTLGDVARAAGVHKATASRALNEATVARVNPVTAMRVRTAARQLGYRPNVYARGLRTRSSRTIGVIVPDIVNPLYPPIVRGIEDALTSRGFTALLANTDMDVDREQLAFDNLLARQVDGFIVGPCEANRALCGEIHAGGTPVVVLTATPDLDGLCGVSFDTPGGMDAVMSLLVGLGHRSIAHIAGPDTIPDPRHRMALFTAAVTRYGLVDADCPVIGSRDLTAMSGAEAMGRILADHPDVTAVSAYNDAMAVGAMRATFAAGLSCPVDMSIVGFNDLPMVADLTPALTTVRVPSQEMGYTAAQLLLSAIGGSTAAMDVLIPVAMVRRESTSHAKTD